MKSTQQRQLSELHVQQSKSLGIREAIRMALRKASIARDTGNRELYQEIRYWLQGNIKKRNTGMRVFI